MESIVMKNYGYPNGPAVRGFVDGSGDLRLNAGNLLSAVVDGSDQDEIAAASAIGAALSGDMGGSADDLYVTCQACQSLLDRAYGLDGGERQADILCRALHLFRDACLDAGGLSGRRILDGPEDAPARRGPWLVLAVCAAAAAGAALLARAACGRRRSYKPVAF